jgi:hypothetical protein
MKLGFPAAGFADGPRFPVEIYLRKSAQSSGGFIFARLCLSMAEKYFLKKNKLRKPRLAA